MSKQEITSLEDMVFSLTSWLTCLPHKRRKRGKGESEKDWWHFWTSKWDKV